MSVSRRTLVNVHLALGSFLLPVTVMFAITGALYTFKITGKYETKTEIALLSAPLEPELNSMTKLAEQFLQEKGLPKPTGGSGIKKAGTSWQFEWTGSNLDLIVEPTESPLEVKVSFKQTSWHRHFVQLHKAKGGFPFKVLAGVLGVGLVLLTLSGWYLGQATPEMRRVRLIATLSGFAVFVFAVLMS